MKREIEKINLRKLFSESGKDLALVLAAVLLGVFYDWTNMEIIIFGLFVAAIIKPIPTRFFAFWALFFLALTPMLIFLERRERAEELAVYAYYFLVLAVMMGVFEIRQKKRSKKA
jgi:hypothetical protein